MLAAVLLTIIIVVAVLSLALVKAAGRADHWERKWIEQRKKEASENHIWCDDKCLHCEQNDWCKFSEVKRN